MKELYLIQPAIQKIKYITAWFKTIVAPTGVEKTNEKRIPKIEVMIENNAETKITFCVRIQ